MSASNVSSLPSFSAFFCHDCIVFLPLPPSFIIPTSVALFTLLKLFLSCPITALTLPPLSLNPISPTMITGKGWWLTYNYLPYASSCCCRSVLYLQSLIPLWLFLPFLLSLTAGGSGSDLPLYGEAASDHRADGVLSGGDQRERPQRFPTGNDSALLLPHFVHITWSGGGCKCFFFRGGTVPSVPKPITSLVKWKST